MRRSRNLGIYLPGKIPRHLGAQRSRYHSRVLKPRQNSVGVAGAKEARRVEIRLSDAIECSQKRVFQAGTFSLCGSLLSCKEVPLTINTL